MLIILTPYEKHENGNFFKEGMSKNKITIKRLVLFYYFYWFLILFSKKWKLMIISIIIW